MSAKRTLSRWLREKESYEDKPTTASTGHWRDAVLADFEEPGHAAVQVPTVAERTPLQVHHLALLAPAGLALFGMGWLLGSGVAFMEQVTAVSPLAWMVGAFLGSAGYVVARRRRFLR